MLEWRNQCESKFVFNPRLSTTEADKNTVRARFAVRKRSLEVALGSGAEKLHRISHEMSQIADDLLPKLEDACQELAQAQADLTVI